MNYGPIVPLLNLVSFFFLSLSHCFFFFFFLRRNESMELNLKWQKLRLAG